MLDCGFILGLESKKNGTAAFTEERARLFLEVVAESPYHELFTVALYTGMRRSELLGLPSLRFHDLRHTHASLMLKQGIHPKVESERLGHSSIGITLDTYSSVMPGLQEAAALRFDEGLRQTAGQSIEKMLANG